MMIRIKHTSILVFILISALIFSTVGCTQQPQSENLMEGITQNTTQPSTAPSPSASVPSTNTNPPTEPESDYLSSAFSSPEAALTDFAVHLFQKSNMSEENTLVSPLSVMYALSMTANGARGETLAQLEATFGMTVNGLNRYLQNCKKHLAPTAGCKLQLANSVWFTNASRFTANQDFLRTNADYYGADIFSAPFDNTTLRDINNWVKEKTAGRIPKILDKIPDSAVMYLINALAFDGEWAKTYTKNQIRPDTFTKSDGKQQNVDFMYSDETTYLETENATGFIKYYKGGKFAFVALLPNEDVALEDCINSLDGNMLHTLLSAPQSATVHAAIPKFETEYSVDLAAILNEMGIVDAFDASRADLSGLGTSEAGNISISRVLHKTYLSLDAQGTIAGAATAIEPTDAGYFAPEDVKTVILDRPFVYMLIDCNTNIPFFIGTVNDLS